MVRKTLPASRQLGSTSHIPPLPNDYISTGQSEGRYCRIDIKPTLLLWLYIHINVDWRTTGAASYQVNTWAESRYPLSGFWLLLTRKVLIQRKTVEKLMVHAYFLMFLPMSLCYALRLWQRIWGNDIHPCLRLYNVQSAWFVSLLGLFAGWALVIAKTSSALQHHVSEIAGKTLVQEPFWVLFYTDAEISCNIWEPNWSSSRKPPGDFQS